MTLLHYLVTIAIIIAWGSFDTQLTLEVEVHGCRNTSGGFASTRLFSLAFLFVSVCFTRYALRSVRHHCNTSRVGEHALGFTGHPMKGPAPSREPTRVETSTDDRKPRQNPMKKQQSTTEPPRPVPRIGTPESQRARRTQVSQTMVTVSPDQECHLTAPSAHGSAVALSINKKAAWAPNRRRRQRTLRTALTVPVDEVKMFRAIMGCWARPPQAESQLPLEPW